jgi:hypothetical protein
MARPSARSAVSSWCCADALSSQRSERAIDGSKFKAVNTRDRNFTQAKMQRRLAQIDESIARYLSQLDSADRQGEAVPEAKITRLNEKIAALRQEIQRLRANMNRHIVLVLPMIARAPVAPPFELTGPVRVIYYAPRQIDHRPNENAADRACLHNCYASSAYHANDRKGEESATTKAKANEGR